MKLSDQAEWLLNLRPLIHSWISEQCRKQHAVIESRKSQEDDDVVPTNEGATRAYADLTLAFGLARLGWTSAGCQQLVKEARGHVDSWDEAHDSLFRAYEYRTRQALERSPPIDPLPADLSENLGRMSQYLYDRLRSYSEALEPHGVINPYRHWSAIPGSWQEEIWVLSDLANPAVLVARVQSLLERSAILSTSEQGEILRVVLRLLPRLEEAQAQSLLARVTSLLSKLGDLVERGALLGVALSAAAHLGDKERVREFAAVLLDLLASQNRAMLAQSQDLLWRRSIKALSDVGLSEELSQLVRRLTETILQGKDLADFRGRLRESELRARRGGEVPPTDWTAPLRGLLYVAAGWFDLGRAGPALQIVAEVWHRLLEDGSERGQARMKLSWAYARVLGHAPLSEGRKRGEELLRQLEGVYDTFITGHHYGLAPLLLVESLVLGMSAETHRLTVTSAP